MTGLFKYTRVHRNNLPSQQFLCMNFNFIVMRFSCHFTIFSDKITFSLKKSQFRQYA